MTFIKKTLAILLCIALLVPMLVSCKDGVKGEQGETEGLEYYTLPDGTYGVKMGTTQYLEEIVIPATYNGKSVTQILAGGFEKASNLKSIMLPNTMMAIGDSAFSECTSLTSVTIPNSVTSIGECAFSGCSGLTSVYITDIAAWCNIIFESYGSNPLYYAKNLYLNGERVTELTIPDSVTSIGDYAFSGCSGLTSIKIPDSVTSIGNDAFSDCSGLTSITIPDSVTSIGDGAFCGCSGLTSITIPNGVTSIGEEAFRDCSGLTSVYYNGTAAEWEEIDIYFYGNDYLTSATRYYFSANEPTTEGNYWRYVDGVPTPW